MGNALMVRYLLILCFAVAALCVALFLFDSGTAKFEPILFDIQTGTLIFKTNGALTLPAKFAGNTPKNEIFIEKTLDGSLFVLFPTWYGRGSDLEGLLYCSRPLAPSDSYSIDWGPGGIHQHMDVGGCNMLSIDALKPNWYKVSRRLD